MIQKKIIKSGNRYRAKVYSKHDKKNYYGSWRKKKKFAAHDEIDLKHKLQTNTFIKESSITLDEAAEIYFDTVAPNKLQIGTIKLEKSNYKNHLKKEFGFRQLDSIKPYEIQQLWETKKKVLANSSIIKLHTFLNKIYQQFIKWNMIKYNPLNGVTKPSPNYAKPNIWTRDEAQKFLKYAKGYQAYMVFWLAIHTGMRKSEITGLTWDNVDFDSNSIFVTQQYNEELKKLVQRGKTVHSLREISLTQSQMERLRKHKKNQYPKTEIVCSNKNGGFLMGRNIRRVKTKICAHTDIKEITLHEFRHTHGSMLASINEPIKHIQERLGHKDVSTTLNYYIHTQRSSHEKAAKHFDEYFNM